MLSQAADKAAEGYVGSQDKSALVDASTGLERPMEDSAGAGNDGLIWFVGLWIRSRKVS